MDENETPAENSVEDWEDISFGKELVKGFVLSAVVSAGTLVGILAVGFAFQKFSEFKEARKTKKTDLT